jgi:hypothetical protein
MLTPRQLCSRSVCYNCGNLSQRLTRAPTSHSVQAKSWTPLNIILNTGFLSSGDRVSRGLPCGGLFPGGPPRVAAVGSTVWLAVFPGGEGLRASLEHSGNARVFNRLGWKNHDRRAVSKLHPWRGAGGSSGKIRGREAAWSQLLPGGRGGAGYGGWGDILSGPELRHLAL